MAIKGAPCPLPGKILATARRKLLRKSIYLFNSMDYQLEGCRIYLGDSLNGSGPKRKKQVKINLLFPWDREIARAAVPNWGEAS